MDRPKGVPLDADDSGEGGFSLIEVLVTVVIMGIGFVAILAGMATTASSASVHRIQAVGELEVRRYAELIQAYPTYSTTSYTAAAVGYTPISDARYSFTAPTATVTCTDEAGHAMASCPANIEIVNVEVDSADGRVTEKLKIVKRNS